MPDSVPTLVPANAYFHPDYATAQCVNFYGLRVFTYEGYAEVDTTTGNSIVLRDREDRPCIIPNPKDPIPLSANDPVYLSHCSFYLPRVGDVRDNKPVTGVVTVGTTDVIKLATAANADMTSNTTPGAVSGAAANGTLPNGVPNGEAISIFDPLPGLKLTAPIELRLYSATAPGAAGVAGGNIRVNALQGRLLLPVRVVYYRKTRSPNLSSFSISDAQVEKFSKL
ncbi:hypothetical protein [Mastigocladopsis repens]|uniref:hypothetical protein n=1 Tax=Mastigocladopsis repens TaxID=221287 RepID=UPI0002D5AB09|nr:hypothetical protein [Mastigocladopsis repens]